MKNKPCRGGGGELVTAPAIYRVINRVIFQITAEIGVQHPDNSRLFTARPFLPDGLALLLNEGIAQG